ALLAPGSRQAAATRLRKSSEYGFIFHSTQLHGARTNCSRICYKMPNINECELNGVRMKYISLPEFAQNLGK
ncbi:hypothetical protein, partial [Hymenobacter rigui]|uniref:hypothetical protein n=1 Tax=Hymenobacter rigui TaxID=334424 RepID=UPI00196A23BF